MRLMGLYFRPLDCLSANESVLAEVKKCLGVKRYEYTVQQKNRLCELLLQDDKLKGLFVCMKELQGSDLKTLEVKEFCVLDKNLEMSLWGRVRDLALKKQAEWISARVRDEKSCSFLLSQGFNERAIEGEREASSSLHQLFLSIKQPPLSECSASQSQAVAASLDKGGALEIANAVSCEKRQAKRKRSPDETGNEGDLQQKIRKIEPQYAQGHRHSVNVHFLP
ncbi:MAG: hypothetical protein K2X08_00670, partial [Chlamydiales bacterium]|nr:hypothetical protein [Chlamydiales bacterium]